LNFNQEKVFMLKITHRLLFLGSAFLLGQVSGGDPQSVESRLAAIESQLAQKNRIQPQLTAPNVFFADASYIFWKAYEEGLSYAAVDNGSVLTGNLTSSNLKFDWNSGFRVGVGYRMPYDSWEVSATWTRLHSRAHGPTLTSNGDISHLVGSGWLAGVAASPEDPPLSISGHLNIHLNVLDGNIARFFQITPHLGLKPHVGIRGLWVAQSYQVLSSGGDLGVGGVLAGNCSAKTHSHCRGIGMNAGVDTEWEFCKDWSFYGNIGGSLLCTTFKVDGSIYFPEVIPSDDDVNFAFRHTLHTTLVPTADLALGLAWSHSFENKAALRIQAGWEFNEFFNQNKMTGLFFSVLSVPTIPISNGISYSEDLTYQGLTVSARLDF
jgi:hypothetical protein